MSNSERIYITADERAVEFDRAWSRAWANIQKAEKDGRDKNKMKDGKVRAYVTLGATDAAVREALTHEGFVYPQAASTSIQGDTLWVTVHTQIRREGVAYVPEPFSMPVLGGIQKGGGGFKPPTAQDVGSALTYARRYALTAILGVAGAEDDDGHQASHQPPPKSAALLTLERKEVALQQLLGIHIDEVQKRIDHAAGFSPKGRPSDDECRRLSEAADRLLAEAKTPPAPELPAHQQAWATAARAYVDSRCADYRRAEGSEPRQDLVDSITAAAVRISCEAADLAKWSPKDATENHCRLAMVALEAATKGGG